MSDSMSTVGGHVITGTLIYAIVRCAECAQTWEQPGLDLSQPGWIVCPHCIAAAPARDEIGAEGA